MITLFGYGICVRVERGHLVLEDGIGARQKNRFARVGHGIRRLVVIDSEGMVSLSALRWLADQDAAFVMLDRDGSVLTTTGPVRPSDSRLRRAQALAHQSGSAVLIARELISQKLFGQERLVSEILRNKAVAETIASTRVALAVADTIERIRQFEAQAAQAYWSAWRHLPIIFPTRDLRHVPEHWRSFGSRKSPLTDSARLAVNPANAILNYLYAVLESEARLSAAAVGLDPGIGVLHVDTDARDSLACDLMEPVRPQVDAYLLDWITRGPLRREWFFEQNDGTCRLLGSFAARLSETATTWGHAVAPFAELVSRLLWSTVRSPRSRFNSPTHLTQSHRREAKGTPVRRTVSAPKPLKLCKTCGARISHRSKYCDSCATVVSTQALVEASKFGRIAAHTTDAEVKRSATLRVHHAERQNWNPSDKPEWLDAKTYCEKVQPRLSELRVRDISSALKVSEQYAIHIRTGKRIPHPRHWKTLAELVHLMPLL